MVGRNINVGGVAEYFNSPIVYGQKHKFYENENINLTWQDCLGGTGEMLKKLEDGSLDMAILLTEGISTKICKGGKSVIVGTYVASFLTWGIYSHIDSSYSSIDEIINHEEKEEKKIEEEKNMYTYAISRIHSGSHIMAYVDLLCRKFNFKKNNINFFECKNFEGAKIALKNKQADFFMWETFTTSHMVENKEWKKIGERETLWPAFVFAASDRFINNSENIKLIEDFVKVTEKCCLFFKDKKNEDECISYINNVYKIKNSDAQYLLQNIKYSSSLTIKYETLVTVFKYLKEAKVIDEEEIKKKHINEYSFVNTNICKIDCDLPSEMYDWRVNCMLNAMNNILEEKKKNNQKEIILVEDLVKLQHIDQYHYLGHIAVDEIIKALNINSNSYVLDVGSGIGGPARYLCDKTKCKVVCVELQTDLVNTSKYVNQKCNLDKLIEVRNDNILEAKFEENTFDYFFSLLVILHIPNRLMVLKKLFHFLKPGGKFAIEDLYIRSNEHTKKEDIDKLNKYVGCFSLSDKVDYELHLKQAGFVNIQFNEMSDIWKDFVNERYSKLLEQQKSSHDDSVFNKRKQLYEVTNEFFISGKLGGLRIYGEKPL